MKNATSQAAPAGSVGLTIDDAPSAAQAFSQPRAKLRMPHLPRWVRVTALWLLTLALCIIVGRKIYQQLRAIQWRDLHPSFRPLGMAVVCLMAVRMLNSISVRALLRSMGQCLDLKWLTGALWVSSLGRYVPGKMMAGVGAAMLIVRRGVPLPATVAVMLLNTMMMLVIGVIFSAPLVLIPELRRQLSRGLGIASIGVIAGGIIVLHPRLFTRLCNLLVRRARLPSQLSGGQYLLAAMVLAMRALWLGAALWFCARAVQPVALRTFPIILSAMSLAGVIGFLFFIVPAGLGAQEAIIMLVFSTGAVGMKAGSPMTPTEMGALVAVLFRGMQAMSDIIAGAVGLLLLHPAISGPPHGIRDNTSGDSSSSQKGSQLP